MNPARYVQVELLYSLMYQRILRLCGRAAALQLVRQWGKQAPPVVAGIRAKGKG